MIIGTGIDIIEIERVKKAIKTRRFVERVFSRREIEYCETKGAQQAASFAARFAGKEALLKAFGTGLRFGKLTDLEILPDDLGAPKVYLGGYFTIMAKEMGIARIFVSLSHARLYAVAQVIFEGEEKNESCKCGENAGN